MIAKIRFEWDHNKAETNYKKHGVAFNEAVSAFYDDNAILFDDPDHSLTEDRQLLIGFSASAELLIVCHCLRDGGNTIRIISARKATKSESRQYVEINQGW